MKSVYRGKRLLVLGGADIHTKVVECANEMGIYTIVADYYEDSPAKRIADQKLLISAANVDEIVKWCKDNPVDGVLSCGIDPLQIPYQQICNKLGLPCYGTHEQFEIMTNKKHFKEFCTNHGVGTIPDYTEEDIVKENVSYPIMIKPTESRGSRGQTICYDKSQAVQALEKAKGESNDGTVIVEKYMKGYQDISNAFFVVNGIPYLVKFGDRYVGKAEDNLDRQAMCTRLPSVLAKEFEKESLTKVKEMVKSLGIQFGPVFLQGFLDEHGKVFYYDPGLRMPGSDYERILKSATGFDIVKSLIHFALTGDTCTCYGHPKQCYNLNGKKAYILDVSVRSGQIATIEYGEDIQHYDRIVYYSQRLNENDYVPSSGDIQQRISEFSVLLNGGESIQQSIQKIYKNYHVYDYEGNDMIVSRVDRIK